MARVVASIDRDEAVGFLPLQAPETAELLRSIPEADRMAAGRLALPSGGVVSGGHIAVPLALAIRRTALIGRLLRTVRASKLLDLIYRVVSANRSRLSKLVPDKPGPRRFP